MAQKGFVGQFETAACGQHGVDEQEGAALDARGGQVVEVNLQRLAGLLFAVGSHEACVGVVEGVEKTLVKGQSGAQHGADDEVVGAHGHLLGAERCGLWHTVHCEERRSLRHRKTSHDLHTPG